MVVTCEGLNRVSVLIAVAAFYAVMLDLCEDRSSCAVRASPETFTQDPCEGTSKYLEAHYKCRPNQFEQRTVCEGEEMEILCGRGDRIAIYSAMFGRAHNASNQCPANKLGYIDCQAAGTVSEVRGLCHGRKFCAILANESVFGDPCATGINKYLTVSYACVPKKILKQLHRKANKKKKKRKKKKKKGGQEDVTEFPDDSETSEAPPTKSSHDHIPDASLPEVYETFEQSSVTQVLPNSATDSPKSENNNEYESSYKAPSETEDITTLQDDAKTPGNVITEAPQHRDHSKHNHRNGAGRGGSGGGDTRDGDDVTDPSYISSSVDGNGANKDIDTAYNTRDSSDNGDRWSPPSSDNSGSDKKDDKDNSDNPSVNNIPGSNGGSRSSSNNYNNNRDNLGRVRGNNNLGANPTNNPPFDTTLNSAPRNNVKGQGSGPDPKPTLPSHPKNAKGSKDSDSPYVMERNLTVLCMNINRTDVKWGGMQRPRDERTIGFLRDWFSTIHFLENHHEKAWLYFTLGICFGIIVMLIVVLIKVCINFRRNTRARLDVSEPTHRSAFTNNHSSLDAPMLEHSDSIDRIEVVRFSPRSTLRSLRSNSHHRDLVNYYG